MTSHSTKIESVTNTSKSRHEFGTKGRRLRVYMHPPSIPTRFQTFHYETREPKAFNSTATRFGDHAHDLPGPGYYQTTGADTAYKIVSTGNAVISKEKRFKDPFNLTPAPTQYRPKEPHYSYSISQHPSPAFQRHIVSPPDEDCGIPPWTARVNKPTPGPADYDASLANNPERKGKGILDYRSRRSDINEPGWTPGLDAPAPGEYYPITAMFDKATSGAVAAFKTTARKVPPVEANPGPGSYNPPSPNEKSAHQQPRYRPVPPMPLAPPPPPPKTPPSHQTSLPHSGAPPLAFPGPGKYNLAYAHDALLRVTSDTCSAFASGTPRFTAKPVASSVGPGAYRPLFPGKRSFRLNMSKDWAA